MKMIKKVEEIFEDKVALPPLALLKAFNILYYSEAGAEELLHIFTCMEQDSRTGGVIFTDYEDKYLITSDTLKDTLTYRICLVEYPEDYTSVSDYTISSPALHVRRTLGDFIQHFFNLEVSLVYKDFWSFPDSLANPLYDHFKQYPFLQTNFNK